jgi:hypothetical protein
MVLRRDAIVFGLREGPEGLLAGILKGEVVRCR